MIATIMVLMFITSSIRSQTFLSPGIIDYAHRSPFLNQHNAKDSVTKKWFLSSYAGVSTSFVFYKGGHATVFSAPIGLQLNRKLNNNLYAFAGVSVAPAYVNFNNAFLNTNINKTSGNSFGRTNSFGAYSRVDLGLTYVNDAKTFSISGSIGIEQSSYPLFPYNQVNTNRQNPVIYPNK